MHDGPEATSEEMVADSSRRHAVIVEYAIQPSPNQQSICRSGVHVFEKKRSSQLAHASSIVSPYEHSFAFLLWRSIHNVINFRKPS
jgi:hypothetical protein